MADRIPLIVNPSVNQIQELPTGDELVLSGQLKLTGTAADTGDIILHGGDDSVAVIAVEKTSGTLSQLSINCRNNADSANVTVANFLVRASNTVELRCMGDITAYYGSDKRLKDNITPIPNAVDKVLSISGNTFNWNENSGYEGKADTGVIAQEIEALNLPGVTETREDGNKAVRYERLVPLLIEAIKELEGRIKTLEG
tara:strand:+ start:140 stop:736 length:597 start_codon:yes stop_codon:yes gene_type:complete